MSNNYVVELDNVKKKFVTRHFLQLDEETRKRQWYKSNEVQAAKGISFGIKEGEIFGLLGPNGAGKTTTVKMISTLVRPDAGTVTVAGMNVEKYRRKVLRQVGVVLEGTRTTMWPLSPLENMSYYGNLKNVKGSLLKERSHELLDFIGLKEKKNVQVRYLSRGQKQKLAICIALIADPKVILLDEPTTGLDVQSSRGIKDKLIEITRSQGKSVLVTTHDMHVAQELCDRIGIIDKGQLIECKRTEELLDVFSDAVFVFKLDREPQRADLDGLHGLEEIIIANEGEGPTLEVHLPMEEQARSAALYAVIQRLNERGYLLRGITQRQQNLESIFLKLTTSTI
ncbi:MAG: ATP-binding cassette domain-containing protein [Candidatus Hydrogenedens sp.]|nr:ATP-binding cassette domain-containing protein [Candidatus Hydrogenedens sp.]